MNILINYFLEKYILLPIKPKEKVPLIKWKELEKTTYKTFDSWRAKYKNFNFGLVLGKKNGIIGIDIDGKEGFKKFNEIMDIRKINTWMYKTPNDGLRLIFQYDGDFNFARKTIFKGTGHNEIAIMSTGTYTLIPPSILQDDKKYEWIEGKTPNDIKISKMPKEILDSLKVKESSEDYGIMVDSENKKVYLNSNIFVSKILKKREIRITKNGTFYIYKKGKFTEKTDLEVVRICKRYFQKFQRDSWQTIYGPNILQILREEVEFLELEGNENYINFKNGLLRLKDFKIIKHSRKILIYNQIPYTYKKGLDCPKFKKYLREVFENDNERIKIIFEIIGYCLTDSTAAQKMFIFYGEGSNGKSVLVKVIEKLLGEENISAVSLEDLQNNFSKAEIINKKLNISSENELSDKLNTQFIKSITSGDRIRSDQKYKNAVNFKPSCKLIFSMNNLPYTRDRSNSFIRRLVIIPFNRYFDESDEIKGLEKTLYSECEGIISVAIAALEDLMKNNYNFTIGKEVKKVLHEYIESNNHYVNFINDRIEYDTSSKITNEELKKEYKKWCEIKGYKKNNMNVDLRLPSELYKAFLIMGWKVEKGHSNGKRYMKNLRFKKIELKTKNLNSNDDLEI